MRPKILIVEEERGLRHFYKKALEAEGYEVMTTDNGRLAMKRLRESPVNVVVFDLSIQDEAGMENLHDLVNANHDVKVMIHAADPALKMDFRTWVADAFVTKSPDPSRLKHAIDGLLEMQVN